MGAAVNFETRASFSLPAGGSRQPARLGQVAQRGEVD